LLINSALFIVDYLKSFEWNKFRRFLFSAK